MPIRLSAVTPRKTAERQKQSLSKLGNFFNGRRLTSNERNVEEGQHDEDAEDRSKAEKVGEPAGKNGKHLKK